MKESKNKKVIRRVGTYLMEHKLLFALTLGLACGMTLLSVAVPSVIQKYWMKFSRRDWGTVVFWPRV